MTPPPRSISSCPRNSRDAAATVAFLACAVLVAFVQPAGAAITAGNLTGGLAFGSGGTVQILAGGAIPHILPNAFDDNHVRVFDEQQALSLSAPLILDTADPALASNVLGVGSVVSSHYLFFDPASTGIDAIGNVSFDEPILGVIRLNDQHDASDPVLGATGITYGVSNPSLEAGDIITFSGSTLNFDITASSPGDALRIVTGTNPTPGINVCAAGTETLTGSVTGGGASTAGGQFKQICDPIGNVGDDNFQSYDLFAFEEQQNVLLQQDLFLDTTTVIAAGETVSSFYVIFDPGPSTSIFATIDFPDTIIGIIVDRSELQSSEFLGDASANYLAPSLLGLEAGDSASFSGSQLTLDVRASTPGDSIRVLLGSASPSLSFNPCVPQDMTLSGSVTGGSAFSAGGQFVQLCEPIGPVGNDNFQTADLFAFEEAQNVILAAPLTTDEGPFPTIATGSLISSYYVAFDPGASLNTVGSIQFPGTILGVMTSTATLTASDSLGAATGTYLNPGLRGLESGIDSVSVAGTTLDVVLTANSPGDYVRVIVAGTPAPVPSMGPVGLGILLAIVCWVGLGGLQSRRESQVRDEGDTEGAHPSNQQ